MLSDELLLLLFSIFKMTGNEQMRLGYNSMGADCISNNLHFHMLSMDQLFDGMDDLDTFPIENTPKKLFFKSSLKHKSSEELNMYNVGFRMGALPQWPVKTLIVSPDVATHNGEQPSLEEAQEALAHAVGVVLNYFIDNNQPHNLLIADEGMTVYIIPRKFDMLIDNLTFFTSFETLCGFIKCKTENTFESITSKDFSSKLASLVSLDEPSFEKIKNDLANKFMQEYDG